MSSSNLPKIVTTRPPSDHHSHQPTITQRPGRLVRSPRNQKSTTLEQSAIYGTLHIVIHIIIGAVTYLAALTYVWLTHRDGPYQLFTSFSSFNETALPEKVATSGSSKDMITRISTTLHLQVYPLEVLQFTILAVIYCRLRNFTARNPLAGNEHLVEKANLVLRNTIEQMAYFELALLIFAVQVKTKFLFLVPFSTAIFVLGRLAFALGYYFHPKYRVVGFVWTMLPTFLLQGVNFLEFHGVDVLSTIDQWW